MRCWHLRSLILSKLKMNILEMKDRIRKKENEIRDLMMGHLQALAATIPLEELLDWTRQRSLESDYPEIKRGKTRPALIVSLDPEYSAELNGQLLILKKVEYDEPLTIRRDPSVERLHHEIKTHFGYRDLEDEVMENSY